MLWGSVCYGFDNALGLCYGFDNALGLCYGFDNALELCYGFDNALGLFTRIVNFTFISITFFVLDV